MKCYTETTDTEVSSDVDGASIGFRSRTPSSEEGGFRSRTPSSEEAVEEGHFETIL